MCFSMNFNCVFLGGYSTRKDRHLFALSSCGSHFHSWMFYHIPFSVFYLNCSLNILSVHQHHYQCLQFAFTVERDRKKCPSHYSNQVCITEMFVAFLVLSLFTLQLLTPVCHCTQTLHSIIRPANTHANQAGRVEATVPNSLCIYMCSCVWLCTFAGVHLG